MRKIDPKRQNTPAKTTIRQLEAWMERGKNREIVVDSTWSLITRFNCDGIFIAKENGVDVCRKIYPGASSRKPNLDFRSTNSHSVRHQALQVLASELDWRDLKNGVLKPDREPGFSMGGYVPCLGDVAVGVVHPAQCIGVDENGNVLEVSFVKNCKEQ